jgi:murein L,D-transpeptidase YcbB/YkuD
MLSQEQITKLEQERSKSLLSQKLQRYHYYGLLEEYQLHPTSIINNFQYTKLNPYQHFLFKRVLHGLNVYDKVEVEKLHWDKKRRISKVWRRSQREINAWKQTICNKQVNSYLKKTFKSNLIESILSVPATETLDDYNNMLTFKQLNIEYEDVILLFMSKGLLPKNYLTLKPNAQQQSLTV